MQAVFLDKSVANGMVEVHVNGYAEVASVVVYVHNDAPMDQPHVGMDSH